MSQMPVLVQFFSYVSLHSWLHGRSHKKAAHVFIPVDDSMIDRFLRIILALDFSVFRHSVVPSTYVTETCLSFATLGESE